MFLIPQNVRTSFLNFLRHPISFNISHRGVKVWGCGNRNLSNQAVDKVNQSLHNYALGQSRLSSDHRQASPSQSTRNFSTLTHGAEPKGRDSLHDMPLDDSVCRSSEFKAWDGSFSSRLSHKLRLIPGATRGLKSRFFLRIPSWTTLPHSIVICDTLWSKGKRLQRFLAGLCRSIPRREQHQGSNISHLILPLTAFDCLSSTAAFHRLSTVDPRLCTWKW
jgi:hypothetical protein